MTPFREFADGVKESLEKLVMGTRGERDPTPMVLLLREEGIQMVAVDHDFFHPDFPERRRELVSKFVVPMIQEHGAQVVGITHAGWLFSAAPDDLPDLPVQRTEIITATVVDREVHEVWWAPLWRDVPGHGFMLGEWRAWPANRQSGLFVTPIQEALR
jgi:hypothetical protein